MPFTLTHQSQTELLLTYTITPHEFAPYLDRAIKEFSNELRIAGFRPGKIPKEMVEREVGKARIYERGARLAIVETYSEVIANERFEAVDTPRVEIVSLGPDKDLVYKATVAVLPPLSLPDYKLIVQHTAHQAVEVKPEELQRALEYLRKSRATTKEVARPAQSGDVVEIDFEGTVEGKKIESLHHTHYPAVVGEGRLIPQFEWNLEGMKKDETKLFSLTLPDAFPDVALRGKTADFSVTVHLVQEYSLPELNDAFAQTLGRFATLEELRTSVEEGLRREKEEKERERFRIAMLEDIAHKTEIPVPDVLIERELDTMFRELEKNLADTGVTPDAYYAHIKKTPESLRNDWRGDALRRVRFALVLRTLGETEHVSVSDEEVAQEARKLLTRYSSAEDAAKRLAPEEAQEYTRGILRNEKVFALLERYAAAKQ